MALNRCALVSTSPIFTSVIPDAMLVSATLARAVLARSSVAVEGTLTATERPPLLSVTIDLTAEMLLKVWKDVRVESYCMACI